MSGWARRNAGLALLLLAGGCRSFVPAQELPDEPIAIHYRTPEEARRRAEALADARRARGPAPVSAERWVGRAARLRADLNLLGAYLEDAFAAGDGERSHAGRLALLDPRSGAVSVVESARRGAVPLDWSADRQRLLFAQSGARPGDVQVWELERRAGTVRALTHGPLRHPQACYGPDGRVVVTAVDLRRDPPTSRLRLGAPGGGGPFEDLSEGPADADPDCSPEGARVVFARAAPGGAGQIWTLETDTPAAARRLAAGHQPRFVGDGAWVVYTAPHGGTLRLFRVRGDGSGRAPIGRDARDAVRPTASPDGRLVAYLAAGEPPRSHLYVRRFDGSGDRILFADGDVEHPVW